MQSKKQRNALISVAVVAAVLLIVLLSLYFSGAWFIVNREAEGTLQFAEGLKINYSGLYEDEDYVSNATNKTLTLAYFNRNKKFALKVGEVTSASKYEIVNPTLTPAEGTVDYYLRVKYSIDLYFKGADSQEKLITDETRAEFLATTVGYELNEQPIAITNERELFEKLPEIDDSKFVLIDGWYYAVDSVTSNPTLATANLKAFEYSGEENPSVSLFKINDEFGGGTVRLYLNNNIDYGENMPFTRMELSLTVEAVETGALSTWEN